MNTKKAAKLSNNVFHMLVGFEKNASLHDLKAEVAISIKGDNLWHNFLHFEVVAHLSLFSFHIKEKSQLRQSC